MWAVPRSSVFHDEPNLFKYIQASGLLLISVSRPHFTLTGGWNTVPQLFCINQLKTTIWNRANLHAYNSCFLQKYLQSPRMIWRGREWKISNQWKKFNIMVALTILLYTLMNHLSGLFHSPEHSFSYPKLTVYFSISEIPMKCSAYIYIQFAKSLLTFWWHFLPSQLSFPISCFSMQLGQQITSTVFSSQWDLFWRKDEPYLR